MDGIDISEVLREEMTVLDKDTFADKEELFDFMSCRFADSGIVTDAEKFKKALYTREEEGSTYIGQMLALPHGICDEVVTPGVGFCRVKTPFTYKSHGEEGEVKYIFMMAIVGEDGQMQHLKILAALARLLAHEEFLEELEHVQNYKELIDAIKKTEREVEICT